MMPAGELDLALLNSVERAYAVIEWVLAGIDEIGPLFWRGCRTGMAKLRTRSTIAPNRARMRLGRRRNTLMHAAADD
jgi:hypothetical protein